MSGLSDKLFKMVQADLDDIEIILKEGLTPYLDIVSKTANHILFSGGKRLRPLLVVLAARISGYEEDYSKKFSAIFEYLHAATLLHDDLVDNANIRRGKPVAHSIYGNSVAVLVGDYLLSRALSIAADLNNPKIIKVIAHITENMSQGEIQQLLNVKNIHITEKEYLTVIYRKTAVLIEGACRIGAILAEASEEIENALATYGYNIGMAFQMADDLLDYRSSSDTLGKKVGTDLSEGKLTLPLIDLLKKADEEEQCFIKKLIQHQNFTKNEFERLLKLLDKYNSLLYTEEKASNYIQKARKGLDIFKSSVTKDIFLMLADYTLIRKV